MKRIFFTNVLMWCGLFSLPFVAAFIWHSLDTLPGPTSTTGQIIILSPSWLRMSRSTCRLFSCLGTLCPTHTKVKLNFLYIWSRGKGIYTLERMESQELQNPICYQIEQFLATMFVFMLCQPERWLERLSLRGCQEAEAWCYTLKVSTGFLHHWKGSIGKKWLLLLQ